MKNILFCTMFVFVLIFCYPNYTLNAAIYDQSAVVSEIIDITPGPIPLAEFPEASGTDVRNNKKAEVDASNANDGYVMVKFLQASSKRLKIVITGPSTSYQYYLKANGEYEVCSLTEGSGSYKIDVLENIEENRFALAFSTTVKVKLKDEFAPFLRPNQKTNYDENSATVKKAAELTEGAENIIEKIAAVYNYAVDNITYDHALAKNVSNGSITEYLPDVDATLESGKGICYDYAAVMTCMLRSQDIPTKQVHGYAGEEYHAWISAYSSETGWIDNVIYFDGASWKLMDPTFAAAGGKSERVMKYIGDGSNYKVKYLY